LTSLMTSVLLFLSNRYELAIACCVLNYAATQYSAIDQLQ
jgi:hypothetical protein